MISSFPHQYACKSVNPEPELAAIITCYFEEATIDEFYRRLAATLKASGRSYEIIFVNDGSTDRTFERLVKIYEENQDVSCLLDFLKNAGQACAITAGIVEAQAKNFLLIDSDLQLDPEELPRLLELFDLGADVVTGIRSLRKDPLQRKLVSKIANYLLNTLSGMNLSDYGCTFKLFRGNLVRAFGYGPFKVWNTLLTMASARKIKEVEVSHHERRIGKSGWTFVRLFDFFLESVLNITTRLFQGFAVAALVLAGFFIIRLLAAFVSDTQIVAEITNGLLLCVFLIVSSLGIAISLALGEYVMRLYRTNQGVPAYVIKTRLKKNEGRAKI